MASKACTPSKITQCLGLPIIYLSIDEEIDDELKYRHPQLEKLKHKVLDLEDMDESLSLTDFNLADFKHELFQHQQLFNAPLGLYALVSNSVWRDFFVYDKQPNTIIIKK